jgi:hypothetical protein
VTPRQPPPVKTSPSHRIATRCPATRVHPTMRVQLPMARPWHPRRGTRCRWKLRARDNQCRQGNRETAAVGEATAGQTHGSSVGGFAALFQAQLATLQPDTQTVLCCGSSCDGIISVSGCHSCSFCKRVQHAHCGVAIGEEGSGQMVNCKSADCVSLR